MKNKELLPIVQEIQQRDMRHFPEFYAAFEKLIRCYGVRFSDDDAAQELTVFLLELVYSLDCDQFLPDDSEALKRYIAVAIRNRYIALSKQRQAHEKMANELLEGMGAFSMNEDSLVLRNALRELPDKQRLAVTYHYVYGYSDREIADRLRITRQAVNRLKNRGLAFLRTYYGL